MQSEKYDPQSMAFLAQLFVRHMCMRMTKAKFDDTQSGNGYTGTAGEVFAHPHHPIHNRARLLDGKQGLRWDAS